jgi:hypothetical protein
MVRHTKRKLRQALRSQWRHQAEAVGEERVHRARAALSLTNIQPGGTARSLGALPRLVTNTAILLAPGRENSANPVRPPEAAACAVPTLSIMPTKLPWKKRIHSTIPVVAFTVIATAALFVTVKLQMPWPARHHQASSTGSVLPNSSEGVSVSVAPRNRDEAQSIVAPAFDIGAPQGSKITQAALGPRSDIEIPVTHSREAAADLRKTAALPSSDETRAFKGAPEQLAPSKLPIDPASNMFLTRSFSNGLPECIAARAERDRLDPTQVTALIRTGRQFLANGDVTAARIALKRAADACDTDAAYLLGTSFDARMLRTGQPAATANIAVARNWYERAKSLGSAEAADQLKRLPSH